jgi:hypothetical protein
MCEIYRIFANDWKDSLFFSENEIIELFNHESFGTPCNKSNGFLIGKKWMDVHIKMWNEDIQKGYLRKIELYNDEKFPNWWLDKILI